MLWRTAVRNTIRWREEKGLRADLFRPFILTSAYRKCRIRANRVLAGARRKSPALFVPVADKIDRATCAPNQPRGVHYEDIFIYSASGGAAGYALVLSEAQQ